MMTRAIVSSITILTAIVANASAYYILHLGPDFWKGLTWTKITDLFFLCVTVLMMTLQMANLSFHKIHL